MARMDYQRYGSARFGRNRELVVPTPARSPHPLPLAVVRRDGTVGARFERRSEAANALGQFEQEEGVSLMLEERP